MSLPARLRFRWLLAAMLCGLTFVPPSASAGQDDVPADFDGDYVFAGGARERRRLERAIDSVVDRMNVFVRELARREIRRNIQPEERVRVRLLERGRMRLTLGDWGPLDVSLDGTTRNVRGPDGGATRLSALYDAGRIVVRQASDRGIRENWLSLADDHDWLFLQVRIFNDQLPSTIRYTLSYRRR